MSADIRSRDVSLHDHDAYLYEDEDGHVVWELIRILEDLGTSRVKLRVEVNDVEADHELPESRKCIEVTAWLFLFYEWEQMIEIADLFDGLQQLVDSRELLVSDLPSLLLELILVINQRLTQLIACQLLSLILLHVLSVTALYPT
jgi:hypothetical protein